MNGKCKEISFDPHQPSRRDEDTFKASKMPLYKFGLISDVQWADIPDGLSVQGMPRYYREALRHAGRAVEAFRKENVDFAIHLGDIVDCNNARMTSMGHMALEKAAACFDRLERPVLHAIGNHCLYNAPRHVLNDRLGINAHKEAMASSAPVHHSYFSYSIPVSERAPDTATLSVGERRQQPESCKFKVIMLDGYDISLLGWPKGHTNRILAERILEQKNPNWNKNNNAGLYGLERRFLGFGGGVSEEQLEWFEKELQKSQNLAERVIVCCHLCLHPKTCPATCLLYNFEEVIQIMTRYRGTVVAALSGHAHCDGHYYLEEAGVHFRVCKAVLETPPGRDCWGIVDVYDSHIEVRGADTFASGLWPLSAPSQ